MKFWKISFFALLAVCLLLPGCKKDTETSKSYLSGSLSLSMPSFVAPGYSKTFDVKELMTLSRDDDGTIGYYFKDPATLVYDTLVLADGTVRKQYYTVEVPDTLGKLSLTFGAFTDDGIYYGSSAAVSFTVVKPGLDGKGSITGFTRTFTDGTFTDSRDGRTYCYTDIDGTDWMRHNLAWEGAGIAYADCDIMSDIYGRYYTYDEALTACPEGWTLPSDEDWVALGRKYGSDAASGKDLEGLAGNLMANLYFNGERMWEFWRGVKITDNSRLSVMPSGYFLIAGDIHTNDALNKYAAFWTSDKDGEYGVVRYIYQDTDTVYRGLMPASDFAVSVRCVRK